MKPIFKSLNKKTLNLIVDLELSKVEKRLIDRNISLKIATKVKQWLADNRLPADFPYYSLVNYPKPERISSLLQPSYDKLARVDARNDG